MGNSAPSYELLEGKGIVPSPLNFRKGFDESDLHDLADSIRQVGIIEPLVVRRIGKNGGVEIVAGERRWRAAAIAGLSTLPCVIRDLTDVQVLEIMAIENNQRAGIHPLEEATGYSRLMQADRSYTPERIAERIGRSKRYVQLRLQYLTLVPEVEAAFRDNRLNAGHADLLVRLSPDDQRKALQASFRTIDLVAIPEAEREAIDALRFDDELPLARGKRAAAVDNPMRVVSVRELDDWIKTHIRADTAQLRMEMPELDTAIGDAETEGRKVLEISLLHKYDLPQAFDLPKDERQELLAARKRIVFADHWKLADGSKGAKKCKASVLGIVTFGHSQGQQLTVCVDKKNCTVHWADEQKQSTTRAKETASREKATETWQDRQAREKLEHAPLLKAVIVAVLAKVPTKLDRKAFNFLYPRLSHGNAPKVAERQFVRELVAVPLTACDNAWRKKLLAQHAKYWGVDVRKIEAGLKTPAAAKQTSAPAKAKAAPKKKPVARTTAAKKGKR